MNERVTHRGALPPGTRIQEFEFLQVLGHGGFGITYKGWNTLIEKTVAIKEYLPADTAVRDFDWSVHPKSSNSVEEFQWGLERFLEEARMLARFDHPSIVRVQQFFAAHGTAYIVMEYLEGQTLGELYGHRRFLKEDYLRNLLGPLLDALQQVHEAEFLHRDIKPSNIMLRQGRTPVLIDFGAARAALAMHSQSMTTIVTPGYSPIEQYSASTEARQGPWTDIYTLGAVLYRGMTGIAPTDATARTMEDPMVSVREAALDQYSTSLIDGVDWALRMRGADRPQTIDEWREVLDREGLPSRHDENRVLAAGSQPPTEISSKKNSSGRMKWLVGMGLVVMLAAGGSLAYWWDELVNLSVSFAERSDPDISNQEHSLLEGVSQIQALLDSSRVSEARATFEELVEMGLDDERRAELESALAQAEARVLASHIEKLLGECQKHVQSIRLAEALGCYRGVLKLDGNHAKATAEVDRLVPLVAWQRADSEKTVEGYFSFEQSYPESVFASLARHKLDELEMEYLQSIEGSDSSGSKHLRYLEIYPDSQFVAPAQSRSSVEETKGLEMAVGTTFRDCSSCPKMIVVPGGTFLMGAPESEEGSADIERPQHWVSIRKFAVGVNEVTREEYREFIDSEKFPTSSGCEVFNETETETEFRFEPEYVLGRSWEIPGINQTDDHPVVCVSWEDAKSYALWLSAKTGHQYRLLSEAEWEYAARSGSQSSRHWGDSLELQCRYENGFDRTLNDFLQGDYGVDSCRDGASHTAAVGSYEANGFGLHDMLGNVMEWVEDCWNHNYASAPKDGRAWTWGVYCQLRVVRGGSWGVSPKGLRSAHRSNLWKDSPSSYIGFRVARTLAP